VKSNRRGRPIGSGDRNELAKSLIRNRHPHNLSGVVRRNANVADPFRREVGHAQSIVR
jgi:hypothetical protein